MLKKLLMAVSAIICITAVSAAAAESSGYIIKLKQGEFSLYSQAANTADGIEKIIEGKELYHADTIEDAYNFAGGRIDMIIPDVQFQLLDVAVSPNDFYYKNKSQWNVDLIKVPAVWAMNNNGSGTDVCVIDTGLYTNHEDIDKNKIVNSYNATVDPDASNVTASMKTNISDIEGHGTSVAGIIAATANNSVGVAGISDGVNLEIAKVMGDDGSLSLTYLMRALDEIARYGKADVVNMSLGATDSELLMSAEYTADMLIASGQYPADRRDELTQIILKNTIDAFAESIDNVIAKTNAIFVAAVGNSGNYSSGANAAENIKFQTEFNYPAAYDEVIGVGSVDQNKNLSAFSQRNTSVFVVAPGESLTTLGLGQKSYRQGRNGTSFSSPTVAAVAALAKSAYPELTVEDFKKILIETSEDRGAAGYDESYGYGLIDAEKVVKAAKALGGQSIDPTVEPTPEPTPTVTPEPTPTATPEPNEYKMSYNQETDSVDISTSDPLADIYLAKYDGKALAGIQRVRIRDIDGVDVDATDIIYKISLPLNTEENCGPDKVFLWNGTTPCHEALIIPKLEPLPTESAMPTQYDFSEMDSSGSGPMVMVVDSIEVYDADNDILVYEISGYTGGGSVSFRTNKNTNVGDSAANVWAVDDSKNYDVIPCWTASSSDSLSDYLKKGDIILYTQDGGLINRFASADSLANSYTADSGFDMSSLVTLGNHPNKSASRVQYYFNKVIGSSEDEIGYRIALDGWEWYFDGTEQIDVVNISKNGEVSISRECDNATELEADAGDYLFVNVTDKGSNVKSLIVYRIEQ